MKIVLASPLYPPDIAAPAPYVKELAKRLASNNTVTVVTYGKLPEQIAGAAIIAVPKNQSLPIRLRNYTKALRNAAKNADILYAQNGASVELPLLLISFLLSKPIILGFGDATAHKRTASHPLLRLLERLVRARTTTIVEEVPMARPIILPFEPYPKDAMHAYEQSWQKHIQTLEQIFTHAKH